MHDLQEWPTSMGMQNLKEDWSSSAPKTAEAVPSPRPAYPVVWIEKQQKNVLIRVRCGDDMLNRDGEVKARIHDGILSVYGYCPACGSFAKNFACRVELDTRNARRMATDDGCWVVVPKISG